MRFCPRALDKAPQHGIGRVVLRCQNEEDLVIEVAVVEFAQSGQIGFEPRLSSFAGAEHGHSWRVEAGMPKQSPPGITNPSNPLVDEVEAEQDLQRREKIKELDHVMRRIAEGKGSRTVRQYR